MGFQIAGAFMIVFGALGLAVSPSAGATVFCCGWILCVLGRISD